MTDGAPQLPDVKWHRHDPDYIRSLLERANLSQRAAARQLGITDRTMRYYLSGEQSMPYSVQYCLEVLAGQGSPAQGLSASTSTIRQLPRHEIRYRTTWYDAAERPLTAKDAGMMIVGRDRFDNPICGYVQVDGFGVVVREPMSIDGRHLSADRLARYTLLDPPPA